MPRPCAQQLVNLTGLCALFMGMLIPLQPAGAQALRGPPANTVLLIVSPNQRGALHTIGAAIARALAISRSRTRSAARPIEIFIKPGIYHERLCIPANAPPMELIGENPANTIVAAARIAYDKNVRQQPVGMWRTATLRVESDNFSAINITFANFGGQGGPGYNRLNGQALAVRMDGSRNLFYHCRFQSWQDTLLINHGRDYFEDCRISGTTDFIFGAGTAWFERCRIHCLGRGFITAAKTPAGQRYGLVFNRCKITASAGTATVLLGRPWGPYAKVAFLRTWMSAAVQPRGWITWHHNPLEQKTVHFAEYRSAGPGAWSPDRAAWTRRLSIRGARSFTVRRVLGGTTHWQPRRLAQDHLIPAFLRLTTPRFGHRVCNIISLGARADGRALCTPAIQQAIDRMAAAGGGEVLIPKGRFVTGPLTLAGGVNLHLSRGAVLAFTNRRSAYAVHRHWYQHCITAIDQTDIAVTGHGVLDGQGGRWWKLYRKTGPGGPPSPAADRLPHRPYLIFMADCRHVLVSNVTLLNSPMCNLVPHQCQDVVVRGIHVLADPHSPNTDGMDPSGRNYLISGCTFDEGDDCIAVKAGGRPHWISSAVENILITHCTFLHGHGVSIGSGTSGGVDNLTVRHCLFQGTQAGIRMKADGRNGGLADHLNYSDLRMNGVLIPILISSYYNDTSPWAYKIPRRAWATGPFPNHPGAPQWRHIRIRHLIATGAKTAGFVVGRPAAPIADLVIQDSRIVAGRPLQVVNAQVRLRHCAILVHDAKKAP